MPTTTTSTPLKANARSKASAAEIVREYGPFAQPEPAHGVSYDGRKLACAASSFAVAVSEGDAARVMFFAPSPPSYQTVVLLVTLIVVGAMAAIVAAYFLWIRCWRSKGSYTKI